MARQGHQIFNELYTTTIESYGSDITDNVFRDQKIANWLKSKNSVTVQGGRTIVEALRYLKTNISYISANSNALPTDQTKSVTSVEYDWKAFATSNTVELWDEVYNVSGKAQIHKLVKERIDIISDSMRQALDDQFGGSATATGSGASEHFNKDVGAFNSLRTLFGTATNTVGGIVAGTGDDAWWRPRILERTTAQSVTESDVSSLIRMCHSGAKMRPDMIVTSSKLYGQLENLLLAKQRINSPKTGESGYYDLMFQGIPVVWSDADEMDDQNQLYVLNSKYIKLVMHSNKWLMPLPPLRDSADDATWYHQTYCFGNLITTGRQYNGAIDYNGTP